MTTWYNHWCMPLRPIKQPHTIVLMCNAFVESQRCIGSTPRGVAEGLLPRR